ncbi:MAG: archaellin/type IV pilin N-terminal domain-containing protein [Candidatus Saliniplasma sp.]
MKRRNVLENDEAVSPVIATILMVAITVVLAATLYMMLPSAEDSGTPVSGNISADYETSSGNVTIEFNSMGTPSNPHWEDLEIYIDDTELEPGTETDDDYDDDDFTFLNDDSELRSGSSLTLEDYSDSEPDEVTIFFDGYDGSLKAEF